MRCFTLECEVELDRPLEEVFSFFAAAENLQWITPPWLSFSILTPQPLRMEVGLRIDYRLRLRGFPLRWTSEITEWNPPHRFTDEQRRGPYRQWIHRHSFEAIGSRTRVQDHVTYALWGGEIVHRWWVRPDLDRIFAYRRHAILSRFRHARPSGGN